MTNCTLDKVHTGLGNACDVVLKAAEGGGLTSDSLTSLSFLVIFGFVFIMLYMED